MYSIITDSSSSQHVTAEVFCHYRFMFLKTWNCRGILSLQTYVPHNMELQRCSVITDSCTLQHGTAEVFSQYRPISICIYYIDLLVFFFQKQREMKYSENTFYLTVSVKKAVLEIENRRTAIVWRVLCLKLLHYVLSL